MPILKSQKTKRSLNGVLLLDKPPEISSNRALQIAKKIYVAEKAGHTGTLDPMATGLLPICFGEATKFSSALLGADKTYEATLKLGYISTTGDANGSISVAGNVELTLVQIESILQSLIGKMTQIPPMYSALKHQGKPLYTYARKGIVIERRPREINIYGLRVVSFEKNIMHITVKCSTGTYVRTLAEDIGKMLGCGGAYLTALRRSAIDNLMLLQAHTLDALDAMSPLQRDACLRPTDSLLHNFPAVILDNMAVLCLLRGQMIVSPVSSNNLIVQEKIRLYDSEEHFLGVGEMTAQRTIIPKRLIAQAAKKIF
ncbi:MAG: tRNA pseudouridine(55) synthase TruB [Nitrosomonadaceae bacterium]|nr:tRNA pseudouridine(55) synthase TruB [Nitrosomonadaceae bacterium]MDW7664575.1 tRNA pseudouridine(55) synthase TruB [Nitrosomonadaceae bacterium]